MIRQGNGNGSDQETPGVLNGEYGVRAHQRAVEQQGRDNWDDIQRDFLRNDIYDSLGATT
jgi:hypothetical protein